jgi:stearoyl-CoA desaturase (delta-9 desaturase)
MLNTIATIALHAGALAAVLLARPSWVDAAMAAGFYVLGMLVVTVGYHRYFAHRAYKTSRVFQALLAFAGCFCTQKGALWWAATHRKHHRYTDLPGDPHSPRQRGFWHSHILWTLSEEHEGYDRSLVRDLEKFPELRALDRFCVVPLVAYMTACFALGGLHAVGWWYCVPTVALMHAVLLVNSVSHMYGRRRFDTADDSRNNWWLAWITFGEGWHNNHHRAMNSARFGLHRGEIDVGYRVLSLLRKLGVVWKLREPSFEIVDEGVDPESKPEAPDGEQTCDAYPSTI